LACTDKTLSKHSQDKAIQCQGNYCFNNHDYFLKVVALT